jgi:hypothetical protein
MGVSRYLREREEVGEGFAETIRGKGFAKLFKLQIDGERMNNFLDSIGIGVSARRA